MKFIARNHILKCLQHGVSNELELIRESEFEKKSVLHFNSLKIAYNGLLVAEMIQEKNGDVNLTDLGKKYAVLGYEEYLNRNKKS